jgi:hypothetical protein
MEATLKNLDFTIPAVFFLITQQIIWTHCKERV